MQKTFIIENIQKYRKCIALLSSIYNLVANAFQLLFCDLKTNFVNVQLLCIKDRTIQNSQFIHCELRLTE